jgi:hypothetical protein
MLSDPDVWYYTNLLVEVEFCLSSVSVGSHVHAVLFPHRYHQVVFTFVHYVLSSPAYHSASSYQDHLLGMQ